MTLTHFGVRVVGVTHLPGYPENLLALMRARDGYRGQCPPRLMLVPDDENPHDDMAVMVVVDPESIDPDLRDQLRNYQLGHLPAPVAGRYRPEIEDWEVGDWQVNVIPSRPGQPGLDLTCVRRAS